jgi:ribosomal protein S18 acetylase RimI-like enzyme
MTTATASDPITLRALNRNDLSGVVAIDTALAGRPRRVYIERRLAAALREPTQHAQLAAVDRAGLAGYILARRLEGEFGRSKPGLRIELVGVRADVRRQGISRRLLEALVDWARRHGVDDLRTAAVWRDVTMLGWLDHTGFDLAGDRVLTCPILGLRDAALEDEGEARERRFDGTARDDFERRARDTADVRSMSEADLADVVRIDREITGRDRARYVGARLTETMLDSAIRVSLTARRDGAIVGYLMARADLGDFGRTEPVAVLDTLGVAPEYARRGVGRALLSQLFINLGALRVERVETVVAQNDLALLGFFQACGFSPSQQLPFVRYLAASG